MNLKPQLAADWRQWHRLWSMRLIVLTTFLAAVAAAYATLPADWLPAIPDVVKRVLAYATLLCAGASGVSRVLLQPNLPGSTLLPPADPPKSDGAP